MIYNTRKPIKVPSFKRKDTQTRLLLAIDSILAHLDNKRPTRLSCRTIEKWFGRLNMPYLKKHLLICTNHHHSEADGICKEYIYSQIGIDFIRYKVANPQNNISFMDFQMNPIIDSSLPVEDDIIKTIRRLHRFDDEFISGQFNMVFKSNRYQHGSLNAMRLPRAMFHWYHGYIHQYDISACAPTLLLQYARSLGLTKSLPAYEAYLGGGKTAIRNKLANLIEMDTKHIKVIINAMYCGASLCPSNRRQLYKRIYKSFMIEFDNEAHISKIYTIAVLKALLKSPFIIQLLKDIKALWKHIGKYRKEWIGIKRKNCKAKWNLYFELENQVMSSIRKYLEDYPHIRYIQEHDGFTSDTVLCTSDMERHVMKITGYSINLEHEVHSFNESFMDLIRDNRLSYQNIIIGNMKGETNVSPDTSIMYAPLRCTTIMSVSLLYSLFFIHVITNARIMHCIITCVMLFKYSIISIGYNDHIYHNNLYDDSS